jgi:DNA repair exonuclease SbcCD ATPase subunit
VWTLAVVGSIVVAFWRRPKPSPLRIVVPKLPVGLSPDHVRAFTEAYEEKNRITSELKFLDIRAQKGKIPRRRYKVQRRTLEVRFDALSRNIAELKEIFRSAGGNYADLIRQLDVAEIELNEVETNIRSVEARHRRGELSLEEYKKFLADYQRRKEKAETAINGILLRLREEIR